MKNSFLTGLIVLLFLALLPALPALGSSTKVLAEVLIQVGRFGGFVAPNFLNVHLPDAVLYSDGRLLADHQVDRSKRCTKLL